MHSHRHDPRLPYLDIVIAHCARPCHSLHSPHAFVYEYLIVCAIYIRPGTQAWWTYLTVSILVFCWLCCHDSSSWWSCSRPGSEWCFLGYLALRASKHGNLHAEIHMKFDKCSFLSAQNNKTRILVPNSVCRCTLFCVTGFLSLSICSPFVAVVSTKLYATLSLMAPTKR